MDLARGAFLLGSSVAAGAINAVAGGGTLLSFPAAMAAGLSPVVANASNAVALMPGSLAAAWAYRGFLGDKKRLALWLALPATVGAVLGAMILRVTKPSVFEAIVPWLILGATLVILLQQLGLRWRSVTVAAAPTATAGSTATAARARRRLLLVLFFQFLVGIYGGYFGGAMGIIMLAYLSLIGGMEIHQMNAIKNLLAGLVNGVASVYFVARGMVDARAAALMTAGAIVGGLVGARIARRIQPRVVRWIVIAIGLGLALIFALRGFGKS
jgi:uncharacterized membrane protein YfcA